MSDVYAGVPSKPKNLTFRPLTKGIVRDVPSALIPDQGAFDIVGSHVYTEGLERRDGHILAFKTAEDVPIKVDFVFEDEVIQDSISFWLTSGSKQLLVLTNRALYVKQGDSFTVAHWQRDYTLSSLASGVITDSTSGRDFEDDAVVAGMYVILHNTSTDEDEYYSIGSVTTDTLTLDESPSGSYDSTFYVLKRFQIETPYIVDWVTAPTRIYFTDGYVTGVCYWDGEVLQKLDIANSDGDESLLGCRTLGYIGDRLFFGYCIDSGAETIHNRIRWSTALNDARVETAAYLDLVDYGGEILKLKTLGPYLIAYLSDGVSCGRLSNLSSLPYVFNKIETGSIGLVGPRAVAGYLDVHFYVGVDDIYALGTDLAPKKLGSAINPISLQKTNVKSLITASIDPQHKRIMFGFPLEQNSRLDTFFAYYYNSQAWARYSKAWASISTLAAETIDTLGDYPSSYWSDFPGKIYDSFGADVSDLSTYYADYSGFLYRTSSEGITDEVPVSDGSGGYTLSTAAISFLYESKDFDFDEPDINKTLIRLGVRISDLTELRDATVNIGVVGSSDHGRTWKSLGTLVFRTGDDEAKVNFRLTGASLRFRLTSTSKVPPYRVEEITLRLRGRGLEGQRGDNA